MWKFEDYVEAGSFLNFFSCDSGWNGGSLTAPLPGGMQWTGWTYENYNVIDDPTHPVVQGVPNPFYGAYASHGHFSNLPADAHIIAHEQSGGQPTIVEYRLGAGWFIAFGQPLEISYDWGWDAGTILVNTLLWGYAYIPASDVWWVWEDPVSGTVPSLSGSHVDVMFTALYTDSTPMPLGTYTATLAVLNNAAEGTQMLPTVMHIVEEFVPPTASFESNSPVCLGEVMVFTDTSDPGVPEQIIAWAWDFGDGITSTLQNPTHLYAEPGIYTVTLTVTQVQTYFTDTYSAVVEVLSPTEAGFEHSIPACVGQSVVFTNTTTGSGPFTWLWDFGDGITDTVENPVHVYDTVGTYTVTLMARGACNEDQASVVIEVLPLPVAGFTYTASGLVVTFTNASQNATAYLWDFGDGITSTLESPVHTYAAAGTYTVTLTAVGPCGTDDFGLAITVAPIGYRIYIPLVLKGYTFP